MTSLPDYARKADPARIVKITCKKKCGGKGRYAEMNAPFPGIEVISKADLGTYKARCLKCGGEALDCHNWYQA